VLGRDLHDIAPRVLVEPIKPEVAEVIAHRFSNGEVILHKPYLRTLNAVHTLTAIGRDSAADEAFRVAPQVAVIDARPGVKLGLHHFELLLARHMLHLVVVKLDRPQGPGWTGQLPAGLAPALIEQMGIERPSLRNLQFLVPPDVAVGADIDEVVATLRLDWIDEHDAIVAFFHRAAAFGDAGRVVAVVAHGRYIGGIDHRRLSALLLQN